MNHRVDTNRDWIGDNRDPATETEHVAALEGERADPYKPPVLAWDAQVQRPDLTAGQGLQRYLAGVRPAGKAQTGSR
jgi:hypothetical protein